MIISIYGLLTVQDTEESRLTWLKWSTPSSEMFLNDLSHLTSLSPKLAKPLKLPKFIIGHLYTTDPCQPLMNAGQKH